MTTTLTCVTLLVAGSVNAAEDDSPFPGAPQVLPADSMAYFRLDDVDDLRQRWSDTSLGKMMDDPAVRPLVSDTYSMLAGLVDDISSEIGISLDEALAIPHGQVAVAVMPRRFEESSDSVQDSDGKKDESEEAIRKRLKRKRARNHSFSVVAIIDAGENLDSLRRLIDRQEAKVNKGKRYVVRRTNIDGIELVRFVPAKGDRQPLEYFTTETTMVIGIGERTASGVLDQWLGRDQEPILADHGQFVSLMSRCIGEEETRPQATFYCDPSAIVQRLMRRNLAASMVIPIVDSLGLKRLRGIGGSSFRGGDFFEEISHAHIAIEPPRDGLLGLVRPIDGPTEPPPWVPADVASYTSFHWRFDVSLKNAESFIGTFTGGKTLDEAIIGPAENWSGISIRDELLPILTGRYALVRRVEEPIRGGSMVSLHAVETNDAAAARSLLEKIRTKQPEWLTVDTIGGKTVYRGKKPSKDVDETKRVPFDPTLVILDDWIIFTTGNDSAAEAIATGGDLRARLADDFEYENVMGELSGMLRGETPFQISFVRGEQWMRIGYEFVKREGNRPVDDDDENVLIAGLRRMAREHELPPFETLKKYFAPAGSFMYDEPGGIHFASYSLRPSDSDD